MRPSLLAGHATGATAFAAAWEYAISLPGGPVDWRLMAAGALPYAVAALNLLLIHHADVQAAAGARAMAGRKASPAARPAVTAPARKAVAQ
jgi:hypothetical protein